MFRRLRVKLYLKLKWLWILPKDCTALLNGDVVMAPWPKIDYKKMAEVQPLNDELREKFTREIFGPR